MSVKRCGNCNHPIYAHEPQDLELCRENDCPCPGFLTIKKGTASPMDEAVAMVRFAHHDHGFTDEFCTPANCSVTEWLDARLQEQDR